MTRATIYSLSDPRSGEVRYIGKAKDLPLRLKSHIRDALRRTRPVCLWVKELVSLGLVPAMLVLEEAEDWREAERRLIALSRARGDRLLNLADGGNEPSMTAEQRTANARRMNEALRDDPRRARARLLKARMSRALREGLVSNRARFKLRMAAALNPEMFGCYADIPYRVTA